MAKYPEWGAKALELYLDGATLAEISQITGVAIQSLSTWKNLYNWDEHRDAFRQQPLSIQQQMVKLLQGKLKNLNAEDVNVNDADIISKLSKAAKDMGSSDDFSKMVIFTMNDFTKKVIELDWEDEKKNVVFEAIQIYMADNRKNIYGETIG